MSLPQISYLRIVFLLYISHLCRKKKKENIFRRCCMFFTWASLVAQRVKASACNAGDLGSIPGSGRSPGEGNGPTDNHTSFT